MAGISFLIRKNECNKHGLAPVYAKITHAGKFFVLSTSVYVFPSEWRDSRVVKNKNARDYNNIINMFESKINEKILEMNLSGELNTLPWEDIQKKIRQVIKGDKGKDKAYDFFPTFDEYLKTKQKPRTRSIYQVTYNRIKKLYGPKLGFADIDIKFVRNFDQAMIDSGMSTNSRSMEHRNLRALINWAINEDIISQNLYPYRKFKIKNEETMKRSMTVEQIRMVRDTAFTCDGKCNDQEAADMFMLIFYLVGINITDLCGLTDIRNGRIEYRRAKTGKLYSIKVEDEALAIIEKYRGVSHLVSFAERYASEDNLRYRLTKRFDRIGQIVGVPDITTYWARHSWATIAHRIGISKDIIAAALGHGTKSVTDVYIDFDRSKVDEANRAVIDYVNGVV